MNTSQVVNILKKTKPVCASDLRGILRLNHIGSGCSRAAYRVKNTNVVIKFPMGQGNHSVNHARREIKSILKIRGKKSLRHLKRFIPKIYYMDLKTGVIAAQMLHDVGTVSYEEVKIVDNLFFDTFRKSSRDIGGGNVGRDNRGQIKLLDMGCI